jgi:hypothetical protein
MGREWGTPPNWPYGAWPPPPQQQRPRPEIALILLGFVAFLLFAWFGLVDVVGPVNLGGGDGYTPSPVVLANRWVSQSVRLTPNSGSASMSASVSFQSDGVSASVPPFVVVSSPTLAEKGPSTLPRLLGPAVRVQVVNQGAVLALCAAPCEVRVGTASEVPSYTQTVDITLTVTDWAGADALDLYVRIGATAGPDNPHPGAINATVGPVTYSSSPTGTP